MNTDRALIRRRKRLRRRIMRRAFLICTAVAVMLAVPIAAIAESDVPEGAFDNTPVYMQATETPAAAPAEEPQTQEVAPAAATEEVQAAPAPVYRAKARPDGRSHIKVTWTRVKGADGYTVYRSTTVKKLGKKIANVKASKKSYKDETAAIDKKYRYTIKAWEKVDGKKVTIATIRAKRVKNSLKYEDLLQVKTYAYSGGGLTASGKKAQVGRVAVDPNVIELGTWLYIEGYGLCEAADTGGAIKGLKIDLYMDSESECVNWGVRHKKVYILK